LRETTGDIACCIQPESNRILCIFQIDHFFYVKKLFIQWLRLSLILRLDCNLNSEAVLGTVLGAAAGAAIDGEHGAGAGAATGLLIGTLAGLDTGRYTASNQQQRYDSAYVQCMYARGHRVPVSAQFLDSRGSNRRALPPRETRPRVPPAPDGYWKNTLEYCG
jgi:hypothetical protein